MKHTKCKIEQQDKWPFSLSIYDGNIRITDIPYGYISTKDTLKEHLARPENKEPQINAKRILEAFNVANETGLTPRQLADQNEKLKEEIAIIGHKYAGYRTVFPDQNKELREALGKILKGEKSYSSYRHFKRETYRHIIEQALKPPKQ